MKKITHPTYADYPEQPYISPERDLEKWEKYPEKFPYSKVERRQMVRLPEGVLPGDLVMLWRIHFDNFTNESTIPEYFEYRYGINSDESIALLKSLELIEDTDAYDSLDLITAPVLKRILKDEGLPAGGKKDELLARAREKISRGRLDELISLRRYRITEKGSELLEKYDEEIQRHGPKKM